MPATADQGVWQLLLVTFVSYALLPVRSLLAIGFGLVVAASHLLVTATLVPAKRPRLWRTVFKAPSIRSGTHLLSGGTGNAGEKGANLLTGQVERDEA